jgi:hypothetical protein
LVVTFSLTSFQGSLHARFFQQNGQCPQGRDDSSFEAVGGVSRASDLLGIGAGTLSKYASTSDEWSRNFIRVDLAVALDAAAGHPFITSTMGDLLGARRPQSFGELTAAAVLKLNGILDDVVREVAMPSLFDLMGAAE